MLKQIGFSKLCILLIYVLSFGSLHAQVMVRGTVFEKESKVALPGATILLNDGPNGTITNEAGEFELNTDIKFPLALKVSYIGYETSQLKVVNNLFPLTIELIPKVYVGEEIVISASRVPEKIIDAPATISKISALQIQQSASPDPMTLLSRVKGVEYNRKGVGVIDFNIRGFNTSFNSRNLILIDSRIGNLIASGLPYLQMTSFDKDDIKSIEVISGPSSALYGFGASNGLVNVTTKDPREYQGSSIAIGAGSQSQFSARFRHAQKLGERLALKLSGSRFIGEDFQYTDSAYYDPIPGDMILPTLGDGAKEVGLNPGFEYDKGEVGLYMDLSDDSDLEINYGYVHGKFIQTTPIGRNQFRGWANQYAQIRYLSPRWFIQSYHSWNHTTNKDSRVLSVLTDNVESYRFFNQIPGIDISEEEALQSAKNLRLLNVLPDGSRIELPVNPQYQDNSKRFNAEVQYNQKWNQVRFLTGAQYQLDRGDSGGTYLIQRNGNSIDYNIFGGYAQMAYSFGQSGWKTIVAARGDNHSAFGFNFTPKLAVTRIRENETWRLTYSRGVVAPTILQLQLAFAGGNLLGNSEGFTLLDVDYATFETTERQIAPLNVEKQDAFEIGYKRNINDKIFVDVNAFYNIHTNFITSATTEIANPTNGTFVIRRGDEPIMNFQQPLFAAGVQLAGSSLEALIDAGVIPANASASTQTYFNFGKLNTYGFDIGLTVHLNERLSVGASYSNFQSSFDDKNLDNDINGDGKVEELIDVQINSPEHKLNLNLDYSRGSFYAGLYTRWTSEFNYFAGNTVASNTIEGLEYFGSPIVEGQPVAGSYNSGPLGGFVNIDLNLGYKFLERYSLSFNVSNLLDSEVRDFVTSPIISRLFFLELKVDIPNSGKRKKN